MKCEILKHFWFLPRALIILILCQVIQGICLYNFMKKQKIPHFLFHLCLLLPSMTHGSVFTMCWSGCHVELITLQLLCQDFITVFLSPHSQHLHNVILSSIVLVFENKQTTGTCKWQEIKIL